MQPYLLDGDLAVSVRTTARGQSDEYIDAFVEVSALYSYPDKMQKLSLVGQRVTLVDLEALRWRSLEIPVEVPQGRVCVRISSSWFG